MTGRVQGKVSVITGGGSGIGEAMVRRFSAEGAIVVVCDVNEASGKAIAKELGAEFYLLDVRLQENWNQLEQHLLSEYGRLDVLLNNAGIVSQQSIAEADVDVWNNLMAINLTGMMLGCQMAIRLMTGGGSIVNTASTTSYLAIPSDAAYVTSKAGVVGLTKSVAVYCATEELNIRCNSIHPGATLTAILQDALHQSPPMNRMGKAEEVAAMALFLASDEAGFCTAGQFPVEGGTVSEHPRMD